MKTFKCFFVLALMTGTISLCHSQTTYYFGYDASGNRYGRSLSLLKSTAQENNGIQKQPQEEIKDKVGKQDILIYPNPVKGELIVKIPALDEDVSASIILFDPLGHLLYRNDKAIHINSIDLSDFSPGTYFMIIGISEESIQWTIVKE
jgi:hypothetical protein